MKNDFFSFIETYKDDIVAFFNALKGFFEALIAKMNGTAEEDGAVEA